MMIMAEREKKAVYIGKISTIKLVHRISHLLLPSLITRNKNDKVTENEKIIFLNNRDINSSRCLPSSRNICIEHPEVIKKPAIAGYKLIT